MDAQMTRAILAVRNREMSLRKAAKTFGVDKSTLRRKLNGKNLKKRGAPQKLSEATEAVLVYLIESMAYIGWGLNKNDVIHVIKNYLEETNQSGLFEGGMPTKRWFYSFLKRNPQLKSKISSSIQSTRAKMTQPEIIDGWFQKLVEIYEKYDFHHKPFHVFNCDETGFNCDSGKMKIVCRKHNRNPKRIGGSNEKVQYTVLTCCNANGDFLGLNILFQGKRNQTKWAFEGPTGAAYDISDSGWMEGKNFVKWFKTIFLQHVNKLEGYKLLYLDGHFSHISEELIKLARENNVILFRLPAHTSHFLQPLNVGVFRNTKAVWEPLLDEFFRTNGFKTVVKDEFCALMKLLVEKGGFKSEHARLGFEQTGLFLLNRDKISADKLFIGSIFNNKPCTSQSSSEGSIENETPLRVAIESYITPVRNPKRRRELLAERNEKI